MRGSFRDETSFFVCIFNESPNALLVEMMKAQDFFQIR